MPKIRKKKQASDEELLELIEKWDWINLEGYGGYPCTVRILPEYIIVAQEGENDPPHVYVMPEKEARERAKEEIEYQKSLGEDDELGDPWAFFPFDIEDEE